MKRGWLKSTALATILSTTLTACGGGGGGVSVVFDAPKNTKSKLGISTDIFGIGGAGSDFISAIQKISEDQLVDASEAIEAFEFVQKHNGTFDPSVLANYDITIDGKSMSLEKGWYALVGYTKKYYEGKESFWSKLVKDKQFDDEDLTYKAIEADMKKDVNKENLIDDLAETGKSTIESTQTTPSLIKTEEGDVTYGVPVINYGDWVETSVSHDIVSEKTTSTEQRTVTTTTPRTRTITKTYMDTTITTFSNGDSKTTKSYRRVESTETLSDSVDTSTESRTVTDTLTYTDTSVTDEVTGTTYGDAYNGDATYTDWSDWSTTSSTTSRTSTDVDNGDGTTTRTTRETTTSSQERSRTKSIQAYRIKTVSYKSYTLREWHHGVTKELDVTTRSVDSTESYGDPVTETETETRTIDDAPGQIVSTETFNNIIDTAYTDADTNLGTRTTGYNTDKTTYETSEYNESNNGYKVYEKINVSSAYSRGWTGKGSIVAVADTGYDVDHSEFEGQVVATKDYTGTGINDNQGHGSHVLGSIVAKKDGTGMHGVAFDAKAVVVKIGDGRSVSLDSAQTGLAWAADQGAVVGNLSANSNYDSWFRDSITKLGDGAFKTTSAYYDYGAGDYYNNMSVDGWKTITDKGMVVVNSAGNQGLDISAMPGWFATEVDSDGNLVLGGKMLIVGSYNFNANSIDGFSNRAGHLCRVIVDDTCRDKYKTSDFYVLAPGWTYSASKDGGYDNKTGTSMAAPIVTGQVAILHQMWPHMTGENLVKLVTSTADKSIAGYDVNIHGQGVVDFDEATRPQGAVGIPTTGRVDGAIASVEGTGGSGSASMASAISNVNIMIIDDFDRDYYINLGNSFTVKDNRKYSDTEMLLADNHTFLPTQQMYGSFAQGGQWDLIRDYNFGFYTGENGSGDYSTNIGKNFFISDGFKLKTSVGLMSEQETWLGNSSGGVLAVGDNNNTNFGNIGVDYQIGNNVLSLDYTRGRTDINTVDDSLIKSFSDVETESYRLAYEIHKDKHNTLGWSFSLPSHITSGTMDLEVAESVNLDGTINYDTIRSDLAQDTKEKNIGFYFNHEPTDTFDSGIKFTTEYRQDIAGQSGKDGMNFTLQFAKKLKTACKFLWMKNPKCFKKDENGEQVLKANLFGETTNNATTHGLKYDLRTDMFVPINPEDPKWKQ
jgi:subtilisin family serine protease